MGLPHLPEMIFPFNKIAIYCNGNLVIEFNAFDALKEVNKEQLPDFKVNLFIFKKKIKATLQ